VRYRVYLADTAFEVWLDSSEELEHLGTRNTRFCSYAETILRLQGEPGIISEPEAI
jgi:hypothetical protein